MAKNATNSLPHLSKPACKHDKPVRIGVNWGSLDQELVTRLMDENNRSAQPAEAQTIMHNIMITSALENAARARELGMPANKIILSLKMSGVQDLIAVYQRIASECNYALHLGLTEAGMGSRGIIASTAALSVLLQAGIGDTIRLSLTPEPGASRTQEVIVAQETAAIPRRARLHPERYRLPRLRQNIQ